MERPTTIIDIAKESFKLGHDIQIPCKILIDYIDELEALIERTKHNIDILKDVINVQRKIDGR